jgi:hypothetical protein
MSRTTGNAEPEKLQRLAPATATPADRAAIAPKDIAWATRQGTNDRNAGTECRKYKKFLGIYKLPSSGLTLQLWNAYLLARQSSAPKSVPRSGGKRKGPVQADPRRKSMPAVVGPSWATRQAREDRITGNVCLTYEDFLRTYGLRKSDASRRVWKAYDERAKLAPRSTPPKSAQKSNWARGLTLSDASARRGTVRRYDRVEPRRSDLSPKNAALLMKVNQQNTLVDMWR